MLEPAEVCYGAPPGSLHPGPVGLLTHYSPVAAASTPQRHFRAKVTKPTAAIFDLMNGRGMWRRLM